MTWIFEPRTSYDPTPVSSNQFSELFWLFSSLKAIIAHCMICILDATNRKYEINHAKTFLQAFWSSAYMCDN